MLHTGAAGDARMWRDGGYVDGLAGFELILFDHRGHGESSTPADPSVYTVDHHVADVVALADQLGVTRFAFWGYSAGARIGYQLAATEPTRIAALVAQGTVDGEDHVEADEWLEDARRVRAQGVEAILGDEPMPPWLSDNLLGTDPEVVARGIECFAGWTPWPLFPQIMAPTLIVAGELEDEGCPDAAARIPNGRALILPGLDHLGGFVQSSAVLPHARAFLEEACGL